MIKTLRPNSKRAKRLIDLYDKSTIYSIYGAYSRPSQAKLIEFEYCEKCAYEDDGTSPRILSYNTYCFTAGYRIWREGKPFLKVYTRDNIYIIEL